MHAQRLIGMSGERGARGMVPRDRTTAGKLGEGPALGSPGVAAPQQRKRRRADGDTGSTRMPHTYQPNTPGDPRGKESREKGGWVDGMRRWGREGLAKWRGGEGNVWEERETCAQASER